MSETELLPKPKREPEPVRRLEVFTGAGRRRRWTAVQKARIVAEARTPRGVRALTRGSRVGTAPLLIRKELRLGLVQARGALASVAFSDDLTRLE